MRMQAAGKNGTNGQLKPAERNKRLWSRKNDLLQLSRMKSTPNTSRKQGDENSREPRFLDEPINIE